MMMLSIKQKDINDKLQSVVAVIDTKSTTDAVDRILDCVLFEVTPTSIKLTTSSTDIQVSTTIAGEFSQSSFSFAINGRSLADIMRNLPAIINVSFSLDNNNVLIQSGKSRYSLPNFLTDANPYPILKLKSTTELFNLPAKIFHQALDSVSFSMGTHHLRYFLSGCRIHAHEGNLVFVSTDTHRLAHFSIPDVVDKAVDRSMILPKKALLYLDKLLNTSNQNSQVCYGEGEFLVVDCVDYLVISKLIVGAYPEYEKVFSQNFTENAIADTQSLRESLQRTASIANDKFKTINFSLQENVLTISSKSLINESAVTEMDVKYPGSLVSFNFNGLYFTELFARFNDKECRLSFIDERSSVVVSFEGNSYFKYVLMPLRV